MYQNNQEGRKENARDIKKLYTDLLRSPTMFSENLEWFGKKALESVQYRSIETMWGTYLSVMKKMDRQLFSEKLYKGTSCKKLNSVFYLLFVKKYYEALMQLALGAANLLEQVKSKCYRGKVDTIRELVEDYKADLLYQGGKMMTDNELSDDTKWKMIRISNRFFAEVYDIVDDSALIAGYSRSATYLKELKEYDKKPSASDMYWDTFERLFDPKGYKRRKRKERFGRFKKKRRR